MHDEPPPRKLNERTGRHYCIVCLGETPAEEYFRNDHVCDKCAKENDERGTMNDERPTRP